MALVAVSVAFPFLLGLPAIVGAVLFLLVAGATLALYRLRRQLSWDEPLSRVRLAVSSVTGLLVVALLIQAVPYGWDRSNPPVTEEPPWDSPRTRELAVRACFDCHSNEVVYPWYAKIAPMSWAVQLHVDRGRDKVNYSEWNRHQEEADESAETVEDGEMPPAYYTILSHRGARLTEQERQDLIDGLNATLGTNEHGREDEGEDD